MDKMKKLNAADTALCEAAIALQRAFTETMLDVVPFNEDDKFIFFKEGEMDYSELPTVTLGDGTSDTCVGLQKGSDGIIYLLFGDGEDEWDTYEYEPEEVSIDGLRDVISLMEEWWLKKHNAD